jgi:hypothetical protein
MLPIRAVLGGNGVRFDGGWRDRAAAGNAGDRKEENKTGLKVPLPQRVIQQGHVEVYGPEGQRRSHAAAFLHSIR